MKATLVAAALAVFVFAHVPTFTTTPAPKWDLEAAPATRSGFRMFVNDGMFGPLAFLGSLRCGWIR